MTPGAGPAEERRVLCTRRDRVAYVTLNRPAVLNAMDVRTHEELGAVLDDIEADDDVWVVVLTGAGDRSFSVGQDLKELVQRTEAGVPPSTFGARDLPGHPRLTERFGFAKPIVARVNGYAFGGGFELALACDVVVAAEHAAFALPEARLGLIPGAGGVFRLTRQVPYRIALGHLMTGRRMPAARARELGLVNDVVPTAELDACVDGWVQDILACAPLSVRAIKEAAQRSATMPLEQAFGTRFGWEERRLRSADAQEGARSFTEKRTPRWTGT
ncbi:enoyl-CoA-hydratase DpgD [Micromonospora sp. NPDC049044]|uniref:enoyl-CoA-hydratase DpgD n=1 Tax=Micromonospora sp. NPDC049044 TaxID=3154827 RepID=UPI0033C74A6B